MRTYHRSLRLDDDLLIEFKKIPYGTANDLINQLLRLFVTNEEVRKLCVLKNPHLHTYRPTRKLKPRVKLELPQPRESKVVIKRPNNKPKPTPLPAITSVRDLTTAPESILSEILPEQK